MGAAKAAAKRPVGGQAKPVDKKTLEGIVKRLRARSTTLTGESRSLGFKQNGSLRHKLRAHLGTSQEYRAVVHRGKRPMGKADKGAKSK